MQYVYVHRNSNVDTADVVKMKEVKPVEYFCFCPFNQYFGIDV